MKAQDIRDAFVFKAEVLLEVNAANPHDLDGFTPAEAYRMAVSQLMDEMVSLVSLSQVRDSVDHPVHYASNGPFECIELAETAVFNTGNMVKYVFRHRDKDDPLEDLCKARWYLHRQLTKGARAKADPQAMLARLAATDHAGAGEFWQAMLDGDIDAMQSTLDSLIERESDAQGRR